jgi:hypothetical protein
MLPPFEMAAGAGSFDWETHIVVEEFTSKK